MLTAAKNQVKVMGLSIRYNIMRAMVNRLSFIISVLFMIINNATFIIQWIILFSLKSEYGGNDLKDIMMLWAMAASTYGISHLFFRGAYELHGLIVEGKLDSFIVQPKNVLLSIITSQTTISSIGDLLYGYLVVIIIGTDFQHIIFYTLYSILGAVSLTALAVLLGSLSFWIVRADVISENINGAVIHFSTYPEGIFKGVVKFLLYTIIPVGFINYIPLRLMIRFQWDEFFYICAFAAGITIVSIITFYRGLKRYSSSNLMSARV